MTWQRADEVLCARRCVGIAWVLIFAPASPKVLPDAPCLAGANDPPQRMSRCSRIALPVSSCDSDMYLLEKAQEESSRANRENSETANETRGTA